MGESYGYLEFLKYERTIQDKSKRKKYYKMMGAALAYGASLSIHDMHQDNFIVNGGKPHLIDLEAALCEFNKGPVQTCLKMALESNTVGSTYFKFSSNYQGIIPDRKDSQTKNAIYETNKPNKTDYRNYLPDLCEGYCSTLKVMKENCSKLNTWCKKMLDRRILVRHVPLPTGYFNNKLRRFYKYKDFRTKIDLQLESMKELIAAEYTDGPQYAPSVGDPIKYSGLKSWNKAVNEEKKYFELPRFAVVQEKHSIADYKTLDVPSFYAFSHQKDLYNARGEKVEVISKNNVTNISRKEYFGDIPANQIINQVQEKFLSARFQNAEKDFKEWFNFTPRKTLEKIAELSKLSEKKK